MSFTVVTNIMTMVLCIAVTVQTIRMMRKLDALKKGDLGDVVAALDQAAVQARIVLCELKATLGKSGVQAEDIGRAAAIADELKLMIELADARAERLAAAAMARIAPPPPAAGAKPKAKPAAKAKTPRKPGAAAGAKPPARLKAAKPAATQPAKPRPAKPMAAKPRADAAKPAARRKVAA